MNIKTLVFDPPLAYPYLIALAVILVALTGYLYARKWGEARFRIPLIVSALLRIVVILTLVFLLAHPQIENIKVTEKLPTLAVLLDSSISMNLPHEQRAGNPVSRWQAAVSAVEQLRNQEALDSYQTKYYLFDQRLEVVSGASLTSLSPKGNRTDLKQALGRLMAEDGYSEYAGVLVFSDGQDTLIQNAAELAETASMTSVPIYPVILGATRVADARISGVHALSTAYLNQELDISVTISNRGLPAKKVELVLYEEDLELNRYGVILPTIGQRVEKTISFTPTRVGWHKYRIAFKPGADDVIEANNEAVFYVQVIKEKLDVLILGGAPDWDMSFLGRFLAKESNLKITSIFKGLKDKFYQADAVRQPLDTPLSSSFKERLEKYDLIILSNLDFTSLGDKMAEKIRSRIEDGGNLLILGGSRSFGAGGYSGTVLAMLSPMIIENNADFVSGDVYPTLATSWPARKQFDAASIDWNSLPALTGFNKMSKLKPAAELIASSAADSSPLIARQYFGLGRVLAVAATGTWRRRFWVAAFEEDNKVYEQFWRELISWLLTFEDKAPVTISCEGSVFQLGTQVRITIKTNKEISENSLTAELMINDQSPLSLEFRKLDKNTAQAEFIPKKLGDYQVRFEEAQTRFSVIKPFEEYLRPEADPKTMKMLASRSGGQVLSVANLASEVEKIPSEKIVEISRENTPFLDFWIIFFILVVLLACEWLIQKLIGFD